MPGWASFGRYWREQVANRWECGSRRAVGASCWGSNNFGELGIGTTAGPEECLSDCSTRPVAISGGLTFTQLSAGQAFTCGVRGSGAAFCWGNNRWGQLGDGTREDRLTPTRVQG